MSLRTRPEWLFFAALHRAAPGLAWAWWGILILRGVLPAVLGVVSGVLIGAVTGSADLTWPLVAIGVAFVLLNVLTPLHQAISANLGRRTASYFFDTLMQGCVTPPGMAHLEDPELAKDLTIARDFDI